MVLFTPDPQPPGEEEEEEEDEESPLVETDGNL